MKILLWLGIEGRKKLRQLEEELEHTKEALERTNRGFKELEIEWSDTLDRINRQVGRIAARTRRASNNEPHVEYDDGVDPISRELLAFRGKR